MSRYETTSAARRAGSPRGGPRPDPAIEARRASVRQLKAEGLSRPEIADALGIPRWTVHDDLRVGYRRPAPAGQPGLLNIAYTLGYPAYSIP